MPIREDRVVFRRPIRTEGTITGRARRSASISLDFDNPWDSNLFEDPVDNIYEQNYSSGLEYRLKKLKKVQYLYLGTGSYSFLPKGALFLGGPVQKDGGVIILDLDLDLTRFNEGEYIKLKLKEEVE